MNGDRYGSAGNGLEEWYWQRLSAVALMFLLPVPLAVLFGVYTGAFDQATLLAVADHLVFRILHTLLAAAVLIHAFLGLKVILEDYVHVAAARIPLVSTLMILAAGTWLWWSAMIWAW